MSFRCSNCSEAQEAGIKPVRRVTKIRDKDYVGGGRGWEIAKEVMLCAACTSRVPDAAPKSVEV